MTLKVAMIAFGTTMLAGGASAVKACPQSMVEELAQRSDAEWVQDAEENNAVWGLYELTGEDAGTFSFALVEGVRGQPPASFSTEEYLTVGCTFGYVNWWENTRAVGDQALVLGDEEPNGFRPRLMYDPDSNRAHLLLQYITTPAEDVE